MAFFSNKKNKDAAAAAAASAAGPSGPSQNSPAGPAAVSGPASLSAAQQQQQQQHQPNMFPAPGSRMEASQQGQQMPPHMQHPGGHYAGNNAPPFESHQGPSQNQGHQAFAGREGAFSPQHQMNGGMLQQGMPPHHQMGHGPPNGIPAQSQQQPGYNGPGPLGAGAPSHAGYGNVSNHSPQSSNYPNGIGIIPPSGSGSSIGMGASAGPGNAAMGPGGLPARNFSGGSGMQQPIQGGSIGPSGSANANMGPNGINAPPLQPIPPTGPQGPAGQQQQQGQAGSQAPGSSPVSYPWSQRQIRLMPVQPARHQLQNGSSTDSLQASSSGNEVSPSPFPRYGHSVNPIAQSSNGDLYLFGGLVKDEVRNDLFMISCSNPNPTSAQSNESKALAGAPVNVSLIETRGERPCPRVGHASVSVGNVLIVWGGDTKTREEDPQDNNLYLLNLGSREWTLVKVTGPSPQGRYGHAAAMKGSKFYVFGGQQDVPPGAPDDAAFLNDLWCFDLQNLKAGKPHWQQIQYAADTPTPPKRTGHTMVNFGDKLFVFGGTDGQYHYNDTWCFSPATATWAELSCIGYIPVPREGHAATLVDDVVYVFGGRSVDGKDLEDLAAFKISNQRWYMFTNMGPAPSGRSGHAMATWHNKVFVLGGESYTTTKHDWPNMVHMLDTGKIKYPNENRKDQASRKTSNSKLHQPPSTTSAIQQTPPGASTAAALQSSLTNRPVQNLANEDVRRAASPNGSDREAGVVNGLKNSANRNQTSAQHTGSPAGSTASPASGQEAKLRAVGDQRRAMSPIDEQPVTEPLTRALSPTGSQRGYNTTQVFGANVNGASAYSTPPNKSQAVMNGLTTSPPANLNALRATARSPSPQLSRSIDPYGQSSVSETYQTALSTSVPSQSVRPSVASDKEKWLQAALEHAVQKGFELPEGNADMRDLGSAGANQQLVSMLLSMRQEVSDLRSAMHEEAKTAEQQLAQANKGRSIALQETAFYRAKIAALEANSTSEIVKLERSRTSDLEKRLQELGTHNAALERQLEEMDAELNHHRDTAQSANEREQASNQRAEAAEGSYSRSLTDYADLQRRAHAHESTIHDHLTKLATLESQVLQLTSKSGQSTERLQTTESALEKHFASLQETQEALAAANAHSSEMESLWQKSKADLAEHQDRVAELESELQRTSSQLQSHQEQVADLERALNASQQEAASLRVMSTGHLKDLLDSTRETRSRDVNGDSANSGDIEALHTELEQHRSLASEAHARSTSAQNEMREARNAQSVLEKQLVLLRSELSTLRTRHAAAVEASSRAQALISQRDLDLWDKARTLEAAEVKNGLLRSLLAENGLSADESGAPDGDQTQESPATLTRKIVELESRLEQRDLAHQDLQSMHDDARQEAESARQRLRASEEQIDKLSREVQSLRLASTSTGTSEESAMRSAKAESDLAALQERHTQLESTHLKAVQYVKGTEKMFRRMKDELNKYKERNEALEQEVAQKGPSGKGHSRNMSTELRPELDDLRSQLSALRQQSESSTSHNEELQSHITRLKAEYDQQITTQQAETAAKIQECEAEIEQLQEALSRAQQDVDDTVEHNKQLKSAMSTSKSSSGETHSTSTSDSAEATGSSTSDVRKIGEELSQALDRVEFLKRENLSLEERCRESESKVTLLLDHIEASGGVEAVASSVGHSTDHEHHPDFQQWKANGGLRRSEEGSDYSASIDSFSQRQNNQPSANSTSAS